MPRLVQALPAGPLAIVGDVHGEIDALDALLGRIGIGEYRSDRGIVFVGDLVDRGPDSVAVVQRVQRLVERGIALVVAGNHELNLLQSDVKEGNGWFFSDDEDVAHLEDGRKIPLRSRRAKPEERRDIVAFLRTLPLVLARDDLRVVHACDDASSLASLPEYGEIAELSSHFGGRIAAELEGGGVSARAAADRRCFAHLKDSVIKPDRHLSDVAREDAAHQNDNPVKVLTSGREREVPEGKHFFTGGKWRFVARDPWWLNRVPRPATVVGHYWRRRNATMPGKKDVWDDIDPFAWYNEVFCVDYCVGRRFAERAEGRLRDFDAALGAMLWPERELLWDERAERTSTVATFGG